MLASPAAPIVLLRPEAAWRALAPNVAHNSPYLGVMLPYSPLHHLLMRACPFPAGGHQRQPRATSPSPSTTTKPAARLGGIADAFLMHDRPVARPCDDSVVRVTRGRENVMRRARGYAPLPVRVDRDCRRSWRWAGT